MILCIFRLLSLALCVSFLFPESKSCKPEPGELSSLNSSNSSKKDDSLKRDRESQDLNDSEEEGDLLEDEDEVGRDVEDFCNRSQILQNFSDVLSLMCTSVQIKSRGRGDDDDEDEEEEEEGEQEEGEDDGDSANGDDS